jgi:valyl-tRNA synthetase
VIDRTGQMCDPAPAAYVGMTVEQARKAVIADLEAGGFLGEIKPHKVPRGRSQRSGAVVEPMLMEQWFVKAAALADKAIEAVEQGKTKFVPEDWTKTYMHWMQNIRDWCISRQLWWGHRIPAWYCDSCGNTMVLREDPLSCNRCGSDNVRQDEDILDTWFSSALWPFSTLGWPEKTRALSTFYPNAVLSTAPDIIFFWVARMMMMGLYFTGKVPFRTVYLTATVTDENGDKMSKVKGNVIDPLDIVLGSTLEAMLARAEAENAPEVAIRGIKKNFAKGVPAMGADALRFSLAALNTSGRFLRLSLDRVEGYRNFINKLWNASRFALMNMDGYDAERFEAQRSNKSSWSLADRWILSRLQGVAAEVDTALEAFRFSDAANALYQFVWHQLCDWYIELAKPFLLQGEPQDTTHSLRRHIVQGVLATVLEQVMRLLHPFAPFVTEEIWQILPKPTQLPESLMVTMYPRGDEHATDREAEATMAQLQEVAVAARMLRSTYGVPPAQVIAVEVRVRDPQMRALLTEHQGLVEHSAKLRMQLVDFDSDAVAGCAKTLVGADIEIAMPLGGLIDPVSEKARISKDVAKTDKEISGLEKKLDNAEFLARAPQEVVAEQTARLLEERARRARLLEALETLAHRDARELP